MIAVYKTVIQTANHFGVFSLIAKKHLTFKMKKIDILNFITDFRKSPNNIKTYSEILSHLGTANEPAIQTMLAELKQLRTVKELEMNNEKAYQVVSK